MTNFTKTAIKKAFLDLLEEQPYNGITVKDIVNKCGINRNSFYYHFNDIPTLLEEIVKESCDGIIDRYPSLSSLEECLCAAADFALENKRAVLHVYRSVDRDIFERYLWKISDYVVVRYFDRVIGDAEIDASDRRILIDFYKCECFGQIMAWAESGMEEDVKVNFLRLCELKKGQVEELICRVRE